MGKEVKCQCGHSFVAGQRPELVSFPRVAQEGSPRPSLGACADCGASVSKSAYNCPRCGKKLRSTPINFLAKIVLVCLGLSVLIGVFIAWVRWLETPDPESARAYERQLQQREWRQQFEGQRAQQDH
jgi:hypothetical protein